MGQGVASNFYTSSIQIKKQDCKMFYLTNLIRKVSSLIVSSIRQENIVESEERK